LKREFGPCCAGDSKEPRIPLGNNAEGIRSSGVFVLRDSVLPLILKGMEFYQLAGQPFVDTYGLWLVSVTPAINASQSPKDDV
jgi:hypothetical protein